MGSSTAAAAPGQHRSARWVLRGRFRAWGLRASGHCALVLSDTYTPDDLHRSRLTTRTSSQMYRSAARILQGGARRSPRSARRWPLLPRRRRWLFNGIIPLFCCITSVIGHKDGTGTVRPISPLPAACAGAGTFGGRSGIAAGHGLCPRSRARARCRTGTTPESPDLTCQPLLPSVSSCPERAGSPQGPAASGASILPHRRQPNVVHQASGRPGEGMLALQ